MRNGYIHNHELTVDGRTILRAEYMHFEGVALEDGTKHLVAVFRPSHDNSYECRVVIENQSGEEVLRLCREAAEALAAEGVEETDCPVCGRRIFGAVAARGVCLECVPEANQEE